MDWTAIGSVAAIAAVAIAIIQYRHSVKSSKPVVSGGFLLPIPKIYSSIQEFRLHLDIFEELSVPYDHEKRTEFDEIRRKLGYLHVSIITIHNKNDFTVQRFAGEVDVRQVLETRVESTKHLAKSAVKLVITDQSLQIFIEDLPAGERVEIICAAAAVFGWKLDPLNAAVEFVTERIR